MFDFATFINFDCKVFRASVASFVFSYDWNTLSIASSTQCRMSFIDRSLVLSNLPSRISNRKKRWRGVKRKKKEIVVVSWSFRFVAFDTCLIDGSAQLSNWYHFAAEVSLCNRSCTNIFDPSEGHTPRDVLCNVAECLTFSHVYELRYQLQTYRVF